jgi:membrane associated rhomboid family serine protease
MSGASHSLREEIRGVLVLVGAIWCVFFLSLVFPGLDRLGVTPRTLTGLVGIPLMPFLHGNFQHLLGNTVPLVVLLLLLAGSRARSWEVVVDVTLLGGLLLWLFGRSATHIGASGLIFGLAGFLIVSGLLERRLLPFMVAVFVAFTYGGTLVFGMIPRFDSEISWEGHLLGAIAGGVVAFGLTGRPSSTSSKAVDAPRETSLLG